MLSLENRDRLIINFKSFYPEWSPDSKKENYILFTTNINHLHWRHI